MRTAEFRRSPSGAATLVFPYDEDFIDDLKRTVPGRFRSYDPAAKIWRVAPPYVSAAERLFHHYFSEMAPPAREVALPQWCQVLYVLPNAPAEVISAAYRVLSRRAHPDAGGSHESMQRLNEAIGQARRGVTK